ncbi:UvrD-helicase domain-containing protein [Corynebacterium sp. Marseille-P4321]|uniref:UvrD-helicase domain-containing protein n=1 Tax=Corynebacterium sp. Marseille-P4321 TaxID=2736603 RepID=UPI00158C7937|nr:UvrD-helicase domain-containing protein [Corynebacterium sp. Marseille-P4321]
MATKKKMRKGPQRGSALVFDEAQRAYLDSPYRSKQIVLAGPGTGKTTVAIQRVINLDGALNSEQDHRYPAAVLFLSFSRASIRAAANSMNTDLAKLDIEFQSQTIDSLAYEICRYDGQMSLSEIERTDFKERLRVASDIADEQGTHLTYDLRHVFIDEAQDVSPAQAEFLNRYLTALPDECGVTVFADPDQEIYRFLDSNGESTPRWDFFHHQLKDVFSWGYFVFHGQYRARSIFMKRMFDDLKGVREEENPARKAVLLDNLQSRLPTVTLERLASSVSSRASDSALLARTNAAVTACFDYLRRTGYTNLSPVFPSDWHESYPSWIGEVACSVSENEFSSHEFKAALETTHLPRLDPDPVSHLDLLLRHQMTWEDVKRSYDAINFRQTTTEPGRLTLSTIHQAKGLEFDDVAILEPEELLLREPVELEVLFVALSRAHNMTYSVIPPDDLLNFRIHGRRLVKHKFSGKRRLLTHISILPGDITVPESLGTKRADHVKHLDRDSFVFFEPILTRSIFSYICTVDGEPVGETTEDFGRLLQRESGATTPPTLGSVPIAELETQFFSGRMGLRPILVPIPYGISEIRYS